MLKTPIFVIFSKYWLCLDELHGGEIPLPPEMSLHAGAAGGEEVVGVHHAVDQRVPHPAECCVAAPLHINKVIEIYKHYHCLSPFVIIVIIIESIIIKLTVCPPEVKTSYNVVESCQAQIKHHKLPAYLGPNHDMKGSVLWWITWRGERWSNFFRSMKNIESKKSMNFER